MPTTRQAISFVLLLLSAAVAAHCAGKPQRWTPLHLAVMRGDAHEVARLIAKGANVNATAPGEPSESGEPFDRRLTPLHVAAEKGRLEAIGEQLDRWDVRGSARAFDLKSRQVAKLDLAAYVRSPG